MLLSKELFFDTMVDTKNKFVTIRTSLILHNYVNASGEKQIILRISCNGTERIPLGFYVKPEQWNKKKQLAFENCLQLKDLNLILKRELGKLNDLEIFYRLSDITPSIERVVEDYKNNLGFGDFISFFKSVLIQRKHTISSSTFAKEETILNKLKEFRGKLLFSEIDEKFFFDYRNFLAKKGNRKTTRNGNIKIIKKYLRFAVKFGIKLPIQIDDIKSGSTKGDKNYLNAQEVKLLYDYYKSSFITPGRKLAIGYFLTSCFTGLRISDIMNQKRHELLKGHFQFRHVKTKKIQNIQLNQKALEIIKHCENLFVKFYSPKHTRETVQEVCAFVGIKKQVNYHTSRHTFGTNCILMGIPVVKVQILMNHSDIKETQAYMHLAELEKNAKADLLDNLF